MVRVREAEGLLRRVRVLTRDLLGRIQELNDLLELDELEVKAGLTAKSLGAFAVTL